ncbi:MAG: MFS transporter [Rhodospirillaceae bacterium]
MYDFANSGYTTVVITAVFNAYFVAQVARNASWATLGWTVALAVSYACVIATAPVIGAYADVHACKKRLLLATTLGCVLCTAALAAAGPGDLALAVVLVILSNYFFSTGENLAAAFLPELADGEAMGRVSGWGWSLGYLGGLLTLGACLAYVMSAQAQGMEASQFVPVTMLMTAAIFALASVPTFVFLRERAVPAPDGRTARSAFARLRSTWRHASDYVDLRRVLVCITCYQAGIQTVVALAAVYAQHVMGFTIRDSMVLIMLVNVAAGAGAFLFGQVQDRLGHVRTLTLTLAGWLTAIVLVAVAQSVVVFWIAAHVVGVCLGASQSAGRALVGYLSPPARTAEFFGLWGLAVKLASILGPVSYGVVTWMSGGSHRLAIVITGLFFVGGLLLLRAVDVGRGRAIALAAT